MLLAWIRRSSICKGDTNTDDMHVRMLLPVLAVLSIAVATVLAYFCGNIERQRSKTWLWCRHKDIAQYNVDPLVTLAVVAVFIFAAMWMVFNYGRIVLKMKAHLYRTEQHLKSLDRSPASSRSYMVCQFVPRFDLAVGVIG